VSAANLWSGLIELNRQADALVERCVRAVEPSLPIGREIPFFASIEARFENLPVSLSAAPATNSDILAGNNVKQAVYQNGGSRVYVRELSFQPYLSRSVTPTQSPAYNARQLSQFGSFPFNWRWNFQTSITQRWYSQDRRVMANAGGRATAGNHLAFREPLIIEPREAFIFECELLSYNPEGNDPTAVVAMILSGYREGV
jgi:hypothetical protein